MGVGAGGSVSGAEAPSQECAGGGGRCACRAGLQVSGEARASQHCTEQPGILTERRKQTLTELKKNLQVELHLFTLNLDVKGTT